MSCCYSELLYDSLPYNVHQYDIVSIYRFQHYPFGWMVELGGLYRLYVSVCLYGSF